MHLPKDPSNNAVYTLGTQIPTKYLLYWHLDLLGLHTRYLGRKMPIQA